jgi:hypothetical protein
MTDTLGMLRRTYDDRYGVWVALQKRYARQMAEGSPCSNTLSRLHLAEKALRIATSDLSMSQRNRQTTTGT